MEQINFPSYDLTGKRALVTGAGSGIGQAAAVILAHYGAKVAVCDISPERAEETVSAIRAAGGEAIPACGDVSNADSVAQIFGAVDEAFGGLDVLISNAGIGGDVLPILEAQEDFTNDGLYEAISKYVADTGVKTGFVMWPIRTAVSGKQMTPAGATEIMEVLGKEESLSRIRKGIEKLS